MTAVDSPPHRPADPPPGRAAGLLLETVVAGIICGFLAVVMSISFASILLPPRLAAYLPVAAGVALFTTAVSALVSALTSDIRGAVSIIQEVPLVVMASLAAPIAAAVSLHAGPGESAVTVFVATALATILTGIVLLVLGYFRLGGLVRYVPYPVMGGFLAGTGWLILEAGLNLTVGAPLGLASLPSLAGDPAVLLKAAAAMAFVAGVALAQRYWRGNLILPIAAVAGIVIYNLVVAVAAIPVATLQASGWVITVPEGTALWPPFVPSDLLAVDWRAVLAGGLGLPGVIIVTVSALLMNASGLELETGEDVDLDRELRSVGIQNLLIGLGGGGPAYPSVSLTLLAGRLGAARRLTGVIVAAIAAASLAVGETIFSIVPTPLLGGLLVFLGGSLIVQWLFVAARRLALPEYAIILLIFAFIVFVDFTSGIGVGLLAAVALFLFQYGRVDSIRHALTGSDYQSTVQISEERRSTLREHGEAILIIRLQGFLFFGTADRLRRTIEGRVRDNHRADGSFLVIDLHRVTGVDSSTAQSFIRLGRMTDHQHLSMVMTGMSADVRSTLERGGVTFGDGSPLRLMPSLDDGLGWCEARLLERVAPGIAAIESCRIGDLLATILGDAGAAKALLPYLARIDLAKGETLVVQGDPSDDIYFIESGRAAVETVAIGRQRVRLAMLGPGAVVGEIAFYTGRSRSASVVAASPLVAWRLSREAMHRFQSEAPAIAFRLHGGLAAMLAGRLATTDRLVRFLAD
jgi:SulP family sulfate permease